MLKVIFSPGLANFAILINISVPTQTCTTTSWQAASEETQQNKSSMKRVKTLCVSAFIYTSSAKMTPV